MADKPILAIMYDFDRTLSPKDMQEYAFIPGIDMTPGEFWGKCSEIERQNQMDQILAYMLVMLREAEGRLLITRDILRKLGKDVELFPGVESWFERVNGYAAVRGLCAEHYIISSGLKPIIEGTKIAGAFREIYAAEFCYNDRGVPYWPAMAVNYTSKTQFLFRINKGVTDVTEHKRLNTYMPEQRRRVPFRNMVYIGDGFTDVPCMRLVKSNGGHSIAVYEKNREVVNEMILQGRVNYAAPADYSENSRMERTVFAVIDQIAAESRTAELQLLCYDKAKEERRKDGAV